MLEAVTNNLSVKEVIEYVFRFAEVAFLPFIAKFGKLILDLRDQQKDILAFFKNPLGGKSQFQELVEKLDLLYHHHLQSKTQ